MANLVADGGEREARQSLTSKSKNQKALGDLAAEGGYTRSVDEDAGI